MDTIISFNPNEDLDIYEMSREQLLAYQTLMNRQLEDLDAREPKRQTGDAYEAWADEHEELEDFLDEIQDLLDEMNG